MKINNLQIYLKEELETEISFRDRDHCLIYSDGNYHGKTTLVRFLIYSFGFNIPSTSGVLMPYYRTVLSLDTENGTTILRREGKTISILGPKGDQVLTCDLSDSDAKTAFLASLFGVKPGLVPYLLGCFYLDQSDGWERLHKGKIAGENSFSVQAFLRILAGVDTSVEETQEKSLLKEISKYQLVSDIYDYAKQNAVEKNQDWSKLPAQYVNDQSALQIKINQLDDQIRSINRVIAKNMTFSDWIAQSYLQVTFDEGKTFNTLTSKNIKGYNANQNLLQSRRALLEIEKKKAQSLLDEVNSKIQALSILPIAPDKMPEVVLNPQQLSAIDQKKVSATLASLRHQVSDLRKDIENKQTPFLMVLQSRFVSIFTDIAKELNVYERFLAGKKNFPFVSDRGRYPGSSRSLIIVSYRLACHSLLAESGVELPFIVDSPGNNELDLENIGLMEEVLAKHIKTNVIVSSIFDSQVASFKKVQIVNKLFDQKKY